MEGYEGREWEQAGCCIGRGAFARVYLVKNGENRYCACKVSGKTDLLQREARLLHRISHPLFPKYYDYWEQDGLGYLLMEYVEGENLETYLDTGRYLPKEEMIQIGMDVASGLCYLHSLRPAVLFRDVKPGNMILNSEHRVRLLDFGCVCTPGKNRDIAGTRGYAAPEQFCVGARLTETCDIYGLGRTLQALGKRKLHGKLEKILNCCTREDPTERPADMQAVLRYLHSCQQDTQKLSEVDRAILRGKLLVLKNIWEY